MSALNGSWVYRSFCPARGTKERAPQITAPWSPQGLMELTTSATGDVYGTLTFANGTPFEVKLAIRGSITAAQGDLLEGVELVGEGPRESITKLRGYFVAGAFVAVVGTVVAVQNDLALQPIGTSGPFILLPVVG